METFFKRKSTDEESSKHDNNEVSSIRPRVELNLDELEIDPARRKNIYEFNVNDRDIIRRHYLQLGPCQSKDHLFPKRVFGKEQRKFNPVWFDMYSTWLEYSISEDSTYCLYCYLFKNYHGSRGGGEVFVTKGFTNWKKGAEKLRQHVGQHNSLHYKCLKACEDLMTQRQHIEVCLSNHSEQMKAEYRARLCASVDCIRWLLRQGLPLRGHDETVDSINRGNFLELLKFLADHNKNISDVVLKNAPENQQLISPKIQKDIIYAAAAETTNLVIKDLGDDYFGILVDESRDISMKEQMVVLLRYVDVQGNVVERYLGSTHVRDTTSLSLKNAIEDLLTVHGLSISKIRGQGYDGASNMRGQFNGLKTLILNENPSAFYVHCFAHQLQLALVAVAKENEDVSSFFYIVAQLFNVVCASCKRKDKLRDKQMEKLVKEISSDMVETGTGLNQEATLKRHGETRWGSHYTTLLNVIHLYSSVVDVLEELREDSNDLRHKGEALTLLQLIECFNFVFFLQLMKNVLGITNGLSQALQKKDQNIINAMRLVDLSKQRLQLMREDGWEDLLEEVSLFCNKHDIPILNMQELYVPQGRSRRRNEERTNLHKYRVEIFYMVLDLKLQELNNRFTELNTELLLCVTCFDPRDSFAMFDKKKLIRLAEFYSNDFSKIDLVVLDNQLQTYILDVRSDVDFSKVTSINELVQKMVATKRHLDYQLVYLLLKLVLILPVATASVERAFSAMKLIKTSLRNRMSDDLLNDCLVTYIEKEIFDKVPNETIIQRFQNMTERRGSL